MTFWFAALDETQSVFFNSPLLQYQVYLRPPTNLFHISNHMTALRHFYMTAKFLFFKSLPRRSHKKLHFSMCMNDNFCRMKILYIFIFQSPLMIHEKNVLAVFSCTCLCVEELLSKTLMSQQCATSPSTGKPTVCMCVLVCVCAYPPSLNDYMDGECGLRVR